APHTDPTHLPASWPLTSPEVRHPLQTRNSVARPLQQLPASRCRRAVQGLLRHPSAPWEAGRPVLEVARARSLQGIPRALASHPSNEFRGSRPVPIALASKFQKPSSSVSTSDVDRSANPGAALFYVWCRQPSRSTRAITRTAPGITSNSAGDSPSDSPSPCTLAGRSVSRRTR